MGDWSKYANGLLDRVDELEADLASARAALRAAQVHVWRAAHDSRGYACAPVSAIDAAALIDAELAKAQK